jgi:hypothetical protein
VEEARSRLDAYRRGEMDAVLFEKILPRLRSAE